MKNSNIFSKSRAAMIAVAALVPVLFITFLLFQSFENETSLVPNFDPVSQLEDMNATQQASLGNLLGASNSQYNEADIPNITAERIEEPFPAVAGSTYYLDAVDGSDTTGSGSAGNPFRTLQHVWPMLEGGDTVLLASGNYGTVQYCSYKCNDLTVELGRGAGDLFADWVTISSAPGEQAEFEMISLELRTETSDPANARVKFKNLTINDGIKLKNGSHIAILDSTINTRTGWQTPGDPAIDTVSGVSANGVSHLLIDNTEIFNTAVGIAFSYVTDSTIVDSVVRDVTHDGIRLASAQHILVENNLLHSMDDGYYDDDPAVDGTTVISRHVDTIHVFQVGGPCEDDFRPSENVVIRNNVMYDVESQHIQFNNYTGCSENRDHWNKNFLFENNIFGPSGANAFNAADPVDGFVVRHNTFLPMPGRTFTSPFRTMDMDNSTFRISNNYERVAIYNNILSNPVTLDDGHILNDWNIVWSNNQSTALGRNSILDTSISFSNLNSFDGVLAANQSAENFGTEVYSSQPLTADLYGTVRDNRPDAGAYEVPGNNPSAEPQFTAAPQYPTTYYDDFADSSHAVDPWLHTATRAGLSWTPDASNVGEWGYVTSDGDTYLKTVIQAGTAYLYSEAGADWDAYTVSFKATNAYLPCCTGLLLFAQDKDTHYRIEISRDNGQIIRVLNGVETILATNDNISLPHYGSRLYTVTIQANGNNTEITVDADQDGSVDLTATDTNATALNTLTSGGVGVYRITDSTNIGASFDDVLVTVTSRTTATPACISYSYSAWSDCQSDSTQTRTVVSTNPSSCSGGAAPVLTQSCTYTEGGSSGEDAATGDDEPITEPDDEPVSDSGDGGTTDSGEGDTQEPVTESPVRVQATANLNVRSEPAGIIITMVPLGTVGTLLNNESYPVDGYNWVLVRFDTGVEGYVADEFISPYSTQPEDPAPVEEPATGTKVQTVSNLNVRAEPNGAILGQQPRGSLGTQSLEAPVQVGGYTWAYVDFETGVDGYVATAYLTSAITDTEDDVQGLIIKLLNEIKRLQKILDDKKNGR